MYIVRDKKTSEIIHTNPAPLEPELSPEDVYYLFDEETMEIGKSDLPFLPEHYTIDTRGQIREMTLEEQVEKGIFQLAPEYKIINNQMVEKSISEKIAEGLIVLKPNEKIVGSGPEEKIVNKTVSELVDTKVIELSDLQKIVKEGDEERIVNKSLEEQVNEGLISLGPNQRITDNKVITYTPEEMIAEGLITLGEYKNMKIEEFSSLSFELREPLVPEYKLANAGLGIYTPEETEQIKATVLAFRDEFYNLKKQVEAAGDVEAILSIKENFPRAMV